MSDSLAMRVARMPEDERQVFIRSWSDRELAALLADWRNFWARPEQVAPDGLWDIWAVIAGRGFGKTRTGAEWIDETALANPGVRGALVHRTAGEVREIMLEGESGILTNTADRDHDRPKYEPSKRRVTYPNGTILTTFTAEEPDLLRGPTHAFGWGDEYATWKGVVGIDGLTAFDNLLFSMRSRKMHPRLVLTTTPKRVPSVKQIEADAKDPGKNVVITRGSMYDNRANLADSFMGMIEGRYAGTSLGDQEILGLLSGTVDGALFTEARFEATRILDPADLPELDKMCVAVDPSVGDGSGDECGITVQALSAGTLPTMLQRPDGLAVVKDLRHGYLLDDASMSGEPDEWARRVSETAEKWGTTLVVVEGNQGGLLLRSVLRNVNPSLRVRVVYARQNKQTRAEPMAQLFAQGRWHLVGRFPELEDQSTTWVPGSDSPDRMDAMVWGGAHLMPSAAYGKAARLPDMSRRISG